MPYTTPVSGDTISVAYAIANIRDQTVVPFATAAARTSAITSPLQGMFSHQNDGKYFVGYDGTTWVPAARYSQMVRKSALKTLNNVSTLENDNHLTLLLAASATYDYELHLNYVSGTTPDMKIGWSLPAGTTMRWGGVDADTAGAVQLPGNMTEATVHPLCGSNGDLSAHYWGTIVVSTTPGSATLQWAQNSAFASDTTIYAGSSFQIWRIS